MTVSRVASRAMRAAVTPASGSTGTSLPLARTFTCDGTSFPSSSARLKWMAESVRAPRNLLTLVLEIVLTRGLRAEPFAVVELVYSSGYDLP